MSKPKFPTPTKIRGRLFFDRHITENYKRELLGLALLERDPRAPIELVSAIQFSDELGRHRRTIGRRIIESQRCTIATEFPEPDAVGNPKAEQKAGGAPRDWARSPSASISHKKG